VHIIPFTWQQTNLRELRAGATVNLETDLIGKHARRGREPVAPPAPLTLERLRQAGFGE
jgi:riboflavin synthase